jgi:hypothetical protein
MTFNDKEHEMSMTPAERHRHGAIWDYLRANPPRVGVPDPERFALYVEAGEIEKGAKRRTEEAAAAAAQRHQDDRRFAALEEEMARLRRGPGGARQNSGRPKKGEPE